MDKWDRRWISLCYFLAQWSEDESTQVGAVIVGERQTYLCGGWNGMPRGINSQIPERHERPEKYHWFEHAERNAIYNAAAEGIMVRGATLYLNATPCPECARAIIQAGLRKVIMESSSFAPKGYRTQELDKSLAMLAEGRVETSLLSKE